MLSDILGLTPREAECYHSLVSVASATPAELAASFGWATGQAGRLLGVLEGRGLARRSPGDDTRFVASPPAAVLRGLLAQRQNELKLAELEVDSLDEIYRAAGPGGRTANVVEVIHGAQAVRERIAHMQFGAREQIMNLVKAPIMSAGNMTDGAAMERGVRCRVIIERTILDEGSPSFDEIDQARIAGEELRIADALPLKVFIVDRKFALVPLFGPAGTGPASALLVHASSLLDALTALFESEWQKATQFVVSARALHNGPAMDDMDAQILSLSLTGLTDQAIATQLDSSLRTVQRRIRHLMDVAKVRSRVQLGFRAARERWLETDQDGGRPS
ncbi:helix-turn-helix domain-containing protein [Streptomyces sp. NPDC020917]|uniref:helix-turn-helix domain-containing protein n=1 Tax=Streptomyces sp. NPDC020917 TaxID=3365102 RepID=UPI003795886F